MNKIRIGIVAPGSRLEPVLAERLMALVQTRFGQNAPEIVVHPQCFLTSGHFAGDDDARAAAFLDIANDPAFDALWFARGGYGSCRLLERIMPALKPTARGKVYLGYSDAGSLLGALYGAGFAGVAHGPMLADLKREGGEAAVIRALGFLTRRDPQSLEPGGAKKSAAFNITILSNLLGTPFQPDLTDHVLMLEEVSEHMYRIDRSFFHLTSNSALRRVAGIKIGRCSAIPPNDPDFGQSEEEIALNWCQRAGIAYLGRADIGHDVANKVVPFGAYPSAAWNELRVSA
jgi:muramoyltetrapeptide carboxypeptidase